MHHLRHLLILIFAVGCASQGIETAPVQAPPVPHPQLPLEVHWSRNSAEYSALVRQVYVAAGQHLGELAAGRAAGTWAVALDADETVIDNSQYQKELFETGESYSRETWYAWAARREAGALPGARQFLEGVRQLGGRIAIVTNRDQVICADTEANLRALDLAFDVILCRGGESRKEPRWRQVTDGTAAPGLPPLEIVMWLGDNIHDFPDLDQDLRSGPDSAFRDFGRRFFVIPNPMYGSWVGNPRN